MDATFGQVCRFRGRVPAEPWRDHLAELIQERLVGDPESAEAGRLASEAVQDLVQAFAEVRMHAPEVADFARGWGDTGASVAGDLELLADALEGLGHRWHLDLCQVAPDGYLLLGVFTTAWRAELSPGDEFAAGVLVEADVRGGAVTLRERVLRLVGANGAVVPARTLEDAPLYDRDATGAVRGHLEHAVRQAFSSDLLKRAVAPLGRARSIRVVDPVLALLEHGADLDDTAAAHVRVRFCRHEGDTLYDAFNALTETARLAPSLRTRLGLERKAGRLLCAFDRLAPSGEPPPSLRTIPTSRDDLPLAR